MKRSNGSVGRFFRGGRRSRQSTGSGVLISHDGYIATNYHVVEDADELEVRLDDNRRLEATLIGTDKDTDLALIKVNTQDMPYVSFGNSDEVSIGEWVLAIGNPFDLNNTVTAGIVSAKARNINLISGVRNQYGIESFIQTDAVVNSGNSGGALVDLDGKLIGINTAIATNTGTFSGYSFAVPSMLVKKVMDDLLEFGAVQRGLLGIQIRDAEGLGTSELSGVWIRSITPGGAAEAANLKVNDVIVGIDDKEVKTTSRLQELVALKRPGDAVLVTFKRDGDLLESTLTLRRREQMMNEIERLSESLDNEIPLSFEIEGAQFRDVSQSIQDNLRIEGGVQIKELGRGAWKKSGVKEGFIITKVGEEDIMSISDLESILETKDDDFYVLGKYPDGKKHYYRIDW
jgi:S1-C subfamily serine protease